MLTIKYHTEFKKDYKRISKRNYNIEKLQLILNLLINDQQLPPKNKDHILQGEYYGFHECHIEPDWLLIYDIEKEENVLKLIRTGTHSDLFR